MSHPPAKPKRCGLRPCLGPPNPVGILPLPGGALRPLSLPLPLAHGARAQAEGEGLGRGCLRRRAGAFRAAPNLLLPSPRLKQSRNNQPDHGAEQGFYEAEAVDEAVKVELLAEAAALCEHEKKGQRIHPEYCVHKALYVPPHAG